MDSVQILTDVINRITDSPVWSLAIGLVGSSTIGTALYSFLRRSKPSPEKKNQYLADNKLLKPPIKRPAYSDRMAYVMAEMSDLAYFEFEGPGGAILDAVEHIQKLNIKSADEVQKFLESFTQGIMGNRALNISFFSKVLEMSGFELIDTIDVGETKGFACKYIGTEKTRQELPYTVIAFRGTEMKISSWLTSAKAEPLTIGKAKVHTGFYEAITKEKDMDDKTAEDKIRDIIKSAAFKDDNGDPLPLFITGHSRGGALALLTTNLVASDINGACYTFGGPRVANYEFFNNLKTPVYRVVNSSDIVPRVPPGASTVVILNVVKLLSWLSKSVPLISIYFDKLENFFDKLNGYRHVGDLRYLTDVASDRFDTVKVLSNPPAIDRIMWMWRHLAASIPLFAKSHGLSVYRRKLQLVANNRNTSSLPYTSNKKQSDNEIISTPGVLSGADVK